MCLCAMVDPPVSHDTPLKIKKGSQRTILGPGKLSQASQDAAITSIPLAADLLRTLTPADQDGRGMATDTGSQQDSR